MDANLGMVWTGDRARVFPEQPVRPGEPADVPPPVPALVGLPRPPAPTFAGREEALARLAALLAAGPAVVTQADGVHAAGGIGKTELALQFAYARRDRYSLVWWVTADAAGSIEFGLAELARLLHPDGQLTGSDREAAIWALLWLRTHTGWLLVLDNVDRRRDVDPLLEQATGGSVIVTTSRDDDWDDTVDGCLRIDVLDRPAAAGLLLELSGSAAEALATESGSAAEALAADLGYLPLALRVAGAYLRETGTDPATYQASLRAEAAAWRGAVPSPGRGRGDVADPVALSMARVTEIEPLAGTILGVLCCLSPDDLPRDVLHHLGERSQVERALAALAAYELIFLAPRTVTAHRRIRAVVAERVDRDEALRAALRALDESAPPGDASAQPATWPRWSALSPHITALAEVCPDEVGGAELAALLGRHALFDQAQGRYEAKYQAEVRALRIEETTFGKDHPVVAVRLNNLANTLVSVGHPHGAEPLQRRALEITEKAAGPDHPDVAVRLNNLALTLTRLARVEEAEPLQRRALAISERALGPGHPTVAIRLGNLAAGLAKLGRTAEAEELSRQALAITEESAGPNHPDVAIRLTTLAEGLEAQGRTAESEPMLRRAMEIMLTVYGPAHPNVAIARSNLATCLLTLGRPAEAAPLLRDALAVAETAFGPDHPETAAALSNLAATMEARAAEPLQRRALTILESLHPNGHPNTGDAAGNLASTLHKLGRIGEAEQLYLRGLAATEAVYGPAHPQVAVRLGQIARFLDATGRKAEAIELLRRRLG